VKVASGAGGLAAAAKGVMVATGPDAGCQIESVREDAS
jgi:hypothetical protein